MRRRRRSCALDGDRRPGQRRRLRRGPARSAAACLRAERDRQRDRRGACAIEANAFDGYRKVIDFSGDSAYSFGGMPIAVARGAALAADIVINGLAILCRAEECSGRPVDYDLEAAFAALIIGGPASFVVTADRDDRFAQAVRRKLVLETHTRPIRGAIPSPGRSGWMAGFPGADREPALPAAAI